MPPASRSAGPASSVTSGIGGAPKSGGQGGSGLRTWFDQQTCQQGSTQIYSPSAKEKSVLASSIIDLEPAHKLSQGGKVSIAVVDSGVAASPAFNGATIEAGYDATGGGNARADNEGHGTAVASIIAGQANAAGAIRGVAPRANIIPVKVVDALPRDQANAEADTYPAASIQSLANGIDWAANNPSVDIITISGSIPTSDPRVEAAVANAVAKNKVVVAAAGNVEKQRGTQTTPASPEPKANLRYPAAYPGVIGVTAIDPTGAVPEGAVLHSPAVDLAAPGMNVVVANGTTGVCLASTQAPATSYATAYVAGAAALVRSYNSRSESAAMTSFRLLSSARRASPSTRDDVYGWGIVDPYRAMTLVDDGQLPGPDSPAHKRATQKPTAGSDVPPAPHDFQKTGRRSGAIWLSVAAGVIVVLLIFTAGRTRAARNKENESDAETGPVP